MDNNTKKSFLEKGFIIIDTGLDNNVLDEARHDMDLINKSKDKKLNPNIYHYNKHPRLIEGWKKSDAIKKISLAPKILQTLETLYTKKPLPFSSINFTYGTEQPLHSDYFHFGSMPELMLSGVWVALEDIDPDAGPLSIVPKSNKSPIVLPEDLGINEKPTNTKRIKENYTLYEEWVKNYIKEQKLEVFTPLLKKGECLIWAANLLHGAGKITNPNKTRYSQVTHYHYEGCDFFYNPNFSSRDNYVERDVYSSLIS